MECRQLGKSGLKVGVLSFGTLWFGLKVKESTALRIVGRPPQAGIGCVDIVDINGKDCRNALCRGPAKEILGGLLKGRRGSVVVVSRVAAIPGPQPSDKGLDRKHISRSLDESLRHRQTNCVGIYCVYEADYKTSLEESPETVCNLVARDGELEPIRLCEVEGVGVSVWTPSTRRAQCFEMVNQLRGMAWLRGVSQLSLVFQLTAEDLAAIAYGRSQGPYRPCFVPGGTGLVLARRQAWARVNNG